MTYKKLQEEKLIQKVIDGDEKAFDELYHRYVRYVYFVAQKTCDNDADSKEVVQETFLEVKRAIGNLQNPDVFRFWLNRITLSKCKNLFRKNKFSTIHDADGKLSASVIEERRYLDPEKMMKFNSDAEVLAHLISRLKKNHQQVLVLFYLEQLSVEEVAELLQIPIGTVKSRLLYARNALKEQILAYEKESGMKLTFHSLDQTIVATFMMQIAKLKIPMFIPKPYGKGIHMTSTMLGKVALVSLAVICAGAGGMVLKNRMEPSTQTPKITLSSFDEQKEHTSFPTLFVKNTTIDTAQSAYYILKQWACCEEEMKAMSKEELQEVQRLYMALQQSDSTYYQQLVKDNWTTAFEKEYTNK